MGADPIAIANLHTRALPDTHAAVDLAAQNAGTQSLGEIHQSGSNFAVKCRSAFGSQTIRKPFNDSLRPANSRITSIR